MKTRILRYFPALFCLLVGSGCASGQGAAPRGPNGGTAPGQGDDPGAAQPETDAGSTDSAGVKEDGSGPEGAKPMGNSEGEPTSPPTDPGSLPSGTKVLHIGDSFAGALGKPLGELFEAAGMRSVLKHTDSSYLTDWAWDGNLQKYVWKYNPDLVMVTLGANELEIVKPELREKTVKKIVETIGDRPCVWVAIPLWDGPKNGLLDVIKKNSAPCVYMDTNALFDTTRMARISDGIHPTTEARKTWAEDVFAWLREHRRPLPEKPWNIE